MNHYGQIAKNTLAAVGEQHAAALEGSAAKAYLACIMGMWADTASFELRADQIENPFHPDSHSFGWFVDGRRASMDAREMTERVRAEQRRKEIAESKKRKKKK